MGIFENRVRFSRIGTGPPRESRSILGNLPNLANLPRFGRFSRIGLDSRRGPVPILENRPLFSKIPKNRPGPPRESRSFLKNLRNLPNLGGKIREIRKILENIGLDSRRGPAPILENRSLFLKIPKNRPRFSGRPSPDSRESNPILEDSEE